MCVTDGRVPVKHNRMDTLRTKQNMGLAMKTPARSSLIALLLMQTACFRAVVVQTPDQDADDAHKFKRLPGIPFYVKTSKYEQTTTYRRSYLRVTMSITRVGQGAGKDISGPDMVENVPKTEAASRAIRELTQFLNSSNVSLAGAVRRFGTLPTIDPASEPWEIQPVSNAVAVIQEVKENPVYYLNAKVPWFGKGSVDTKLGSDGTLTEANTSAESNLAANGLPDLVPFKSYLESQYGVTVSGSDKASGFAPEVKVGTTIPLKFELAVEEVGELATFEKILGDDPRSGVLPALPMDFVTGQFTIRPLDASAKAKENAKAWSLSATLTPPKSDDGGNGKPDGSTALPQ